MSAGCLTIESEVHAVESEGLTPVIVCDKREAFAQGSDSDEAVHYFSERKNGWLRGACHRARIRATRWLAMTPMVMREV